MQKPIANLLLLFAIGYCAFNLWQTGTSRTKGNDFAHYYVSSRIWLEGSDQVYEKDFEPYYQSLNLRPETNEVLVGQATNPPGLIVLFAPVATLSPNAAFLVWNSIQAICLILAVFLCWSLVKSHVSVEDFKIVVSLFLLSQIVTRHFYFSQVQLLLLVLVLIAYRFSLRGNHRIACSIICVTALIKVFPAFLLPWFVWQAKGLTQKIRLGLLSLIVLGIGICLTGVPLWQTFLGNATAEISTWSNANTSLTLSSLMSKIGKFAFNSESMLFNYESGVVLSAIVALAIYAYALFACKNKNIQFSLLILAMLMCGPTCWLHYLVFALFPVCVICEGCDPKMSLAKMFGATLLFLCINHFFMTETNSLLILFGFKYAPLAGLIAIMAILIRKNTLAEHGKIRVPKSHEEVLNLHNATV